MRKTNKVNVAKNKKASNTSLRKKVINSKLDDDFIKNVFVDANIFEKNNFFHSTNIHTLLRYAREQVINLYMTKVSKMELISRMKKNLLQYHESHRQLVKSFNKNSRILKNLTDYKELKIEDKFVNEAIIELKSKLDNLIFSSKIKVLDTKINADNVFELFYTSKPPFSSNEQKKYEFPDAFIVLTLDNWCRTNKQKMIFITQDNDFNGYVSNHITFVNDLQQYLVGVTEYWDLRLNRKIIPRINRIIAQNSQYFIDRTKEKLPNIIMFQYDSSVFSHPVIKDIEYLNRSIISIWGDFAEIIISYKVYYEYLKILNPYAYKEAAIEDTVREKRFYGSIEISAEFEVYYSNGIDKTDIKRINSNEHILIQIPDMDS